MFKAKRKFEGDIGCVWQKDDTLDRKFKSLKEYCDFYSVRHYFLKCGCAPCFEFFFEKELVKDYLEKSVSAGDLLEIWSINKDKIEYICAKMPDDNGLIPVEGCSY